MEPLTVLALITIGGALLITAVWLNNRAAVKKYRAEQERLALREHRVNQARNGAPRVRLSDVITDAGTARHRRTHTSSGRRIRRDDTTDSILYGSLAAANTTYITDTTPSCDTSSSTDSGSCGGGE